MLIDDWMPAPQFRAAHRRVIPVPPATVYRALSEARFTRPALVRLLLGLRAVPALFLHRRPALDPAAGFASWSVGRLPFTLLDAAPPEELVLGLQGAFWQLDGGLVPTGPAGFRTPVPSGLARAIWNFHVAPGRDGSVLSTETRVACGDEGARRRFGRYWRVVAPFSGLIRGAMLREVERTITG
jgi:hypothetical protein